MIEDDITFAQYLLLYAAIGKTPNLCATTGYNALGPLALYRLARKYD